MRPSDHISSSTNHVRRSHPEILQRIFPSFIDLAASPNPKFTCYTNTTHSWSRSCIDYILLHPKMIHSNHQTYTLLLPNDSDHRAVITTFTKQQRTPTWRLNSNLLNNPSTTRIINNILNSHSPIQFPHEWDDCKDQIQSLLKSVGRPAARCRREGIKNLTNRLRKLQSLNPPPLAKITAIQTTLKALQDIQAKSIAIQSRVRWIEQGEQSS